MSEGSGRWFGLVGLAKRRGVSLRYVMAIVGELGIPWVETERGVQVTAGGLAAVKRVMESRRVGCLELEFEEEGEN
jgi:hypothetical protein